MNVDIYPREIQIQIQISDSDLLLFMPLDDSFRELKDKQMEDEEDTLINLLQKFTDKMSYLVRCSALRHIATHPLLWMHIVVCFEVESLFGTGLKTSLTTYAEPQ